MDRRRFLQSAGVVSASLALPKSARLFALGISPRAWRTFEVTASVEVAQSLRPTLVWLPAALLRETPFQKTLANEFRAEGGKAELVENKVDALGIVAARFPEGVKPVLTLTSRVTTRNYAVDLDAARQGAEAGPRGARLLPSTVAARADRRHRQGAGRRVHPGRHDGPRKGAQHLRLGRRQHVPEPENARLRRRRHPLHAGIRRPRRQVRRPQRALRRPRPRRGPSRASRLRAAHREVRPGYKSLGPATES